MRVEVPHVRLTTYHFFPIRIVQQRLLLQCVAHVKALDRVRLHRTFITHRPSSVFYYALLIFYFTSTDAPPSTPGFPSATSSAPCFLPSRTLLLLRLLMRSSSPAATHPRGGSGRSPAAPTRSRPHWCSVGRTARRAFLPHHYIASSLLNSLTSLRPGRSRCCH